jgi:hypothetical protein
MGEASRRRVMELHDSVKEARKLKRPSRNKETASHIWPALRAENLPGDSGTRVVTTDREIADN